MTGPTSTTASYLPARYNDSAEVRQVEPYVYAQFTHGPTSPRFGQSRNPWLTGTASWTYIGVTQYILGIRPVLPVSRSTRACRRQWDGFDVERLFRGSRVTISVTNPHHVSRGVVSLEVDGVPVAGTVAPVELLHDGALVSVRMG